MFLAPAPETVKLVWFSFESLLGIVRMNKDARAFVAGAMDQVSEWIVVAAVHVERYERRDNNDPMEVNEAISALLKTLLQFSFDVWKSGFLDLHQVHEEGKRDSSASGRISSSFRFFHDRGKDIVDSGITHLQQFG